MKIMLRLQGGTGGVFSCALTPEIGGTHPPLTVLVDAGTRAELPDEEWLMRCGHRHQLFPRFRFCLSPNLGKDLGHDIQCYAPADRLG